MQKKRAKYIHQDTMKKIGTSKDFSQILAMSTCSSDYTDARTVILAVMKSLFAGEVRRRSKRK